GHHVTREAGDFVDLFVQRDAFLQVLELDRAADFSEDGKGVRIPLDQNLTKLYRPAFHDLDLGAIHNRIALAFASLLVHHRNRALTIHDHQVASLRLHRLQVDEANQTVALGIEARLLRNSRRRASDVEGAHGELRSRFADGLRRDHTGGLAQFNQSPGGEIASVAHDANAAPGLTSEHRADLYPLDTGGLNCPGEIFRDLVIHVDHDLAFIVLDLLERYAAHDTVAQRLNDFAGFDDTGDEDSVHGAAVVFADDHVLRDVHQTARQVTRVGRLQSRVGQALAGAVRRDEVFEHRQPFTEIGRDRRLNNFTRRFRHQSAHTGELANLLFRSAGAGIGHDVNRVEFALFVPSLHLVEHFIGYFFRNGRPDFDDLVVAFAVGDRAVQVLLLHADHLFVGIFYQGLLVVRDHHVIDADGEAGARGVLEPERLDLIEHLDRDFQAESQIAVIDQLADALLLEQSVDIRHAQVDAGHSLGQMVVENGTADGGIQELALNVHGFRVVHVLIVIGLRQVNDLAGVAQTNR